ncbi:MAG: hypothetical protein OEN02_03785 [Gammaproteobacteria bacterium]|nr:hypothetical protein [Gammaproteobacteria bacterium]
MLTILIVSLLAQLAGGAVNASNHDIGSSNKDPRKLITIFRYRGVEPDTNSSVQFGMFVGLIEQKFANLREHFVKEIDQGAESSVVKYIDTISIKPNKEGELPGSNSLVRDWMLAEIDLLQVLRGTMFTTPQGDANLMTRSHFVEDPVQGNLRNFSIRLKLTEDEYANTRDSHSLVILYSIATEAKRMGVEPSQIAVIVSYALNSIADLERRSGPLQGEMLEIKNAWQEFKNAL